MRIIAILCVLLAVGLVHEAAAQPYQPDIPEFRKVARSQDEFSELPVYYAIERGATLYHASDSSRAYLHLRFREPLQVLEYGPRWTRVQTMDGAAGVVKTEHISNVWIRVSKKEQTLYLYRGPRLMAKYATDLGYNFFADKERRGSAAEPDHWRTPNGEFFVVRKNPQSEFYRAFVLNYPNGEDAERGRRAGLITDSQYEAIIRAERFAEVPPMNTELGGFIEIHGDGTGRRSNWTYGCIAVRNDEIDLLWNFVEVGTPVLIDS